MKPRLDFVRVAPKPYEALVGLEKHLGGCSIEPGLTDLVKLRASQLNGCAYCIDMHWKDARARGESEQRLYGLDAWREAPYYSEWVANPLVIMSIESKADSRARSWHWRAPLSTS